MHNIVDYAIQYLDYAILHSMVIFTQLTGYMALQRGAYYISPCAKGCTWNEAAWVWILPWMPTLPICTGSVSVTSNPLKLSSSHQHTSKCNILRTIAAHFSQAWTQGSHCIALPVCTVDRVCRVSSAISHSSENTDRLRIIDHIIFITRLVTGDANSLSLSELGTSCPDRLTPYTHAHNIHLVSCSS